MKIRKGKLSDLQEVYKTLNKTLELQGGTGGETYSKEWVKTALTDKERELFLIAEEKNKIIGLLSAELWKNKKYSFFLDIFVEPEYRKKGVASALLKEYEEICKDIGIKKFIALVLITNKRMQNFIEKRNYKRGDKFYFYEKNRK